jgi:hypothetical protein
VTRLPKLCLVRDKVSGGVSLARFATLYAQLNGCRDLQNVYTATKQIDVMTRSQVLDLYFMDARSKLIDLAAFIDRVDRAEGKEDFRMKAFRDALAELSQNKKDKAKQVLLAFSDPTTKPIAKAAGKGAVGAYSSHES